MKAIPITLGMALAVVALTVVAFAKERTWTDKTGKFKVAAELVEVENGKAVLRTSEGKQVKVPLERLSEADREFIAKRPKENEPVDEHIIEKTITEIATRFYDDLRTREREVARASLTKRAQELMAAGPSPLQGLPKPELGDKSIRPGKVKIEADTAEIDVFVLAGGMNHKTKLHFRQEDDQWVVFALSAKYHQGEQSIDFEAAIVPQQAGDPLQALVGEPFALEGYTLDGRPIEMSQFKGKVVLVDFWATWCGPCRAEIPNIAKNYEKYHDAGFEVIAVSVDRDLSALATFVTQEKPPWPVVADNHPRNSKSMAARYGIRGIPAFILVGADGKVAAVHCRGEQLGQLVGQLTAKGG